jgi:hypothetical protein
MRWAIVITTTFTTATTITIISRHHHRCERARAPTCRSKPNRSRLLSPQPSHRRQRRARADVSYAAALKCRCLTSFEGIAAGRTTQPCSTCLCFWRKRGERAIVRLDVGQDPSTHAVNLSSYNISVARQWRLENEHEGDPRAASACSVQRLYAVVGSRRWV